MEKINVGIIGSGLVGSAVGIGFHNIGHNVQFFDINTHTIENLVNSGYQATTDLEMVVKNSQVFFICVPTPDRDSKIDLSMIKTAIKNLSIACRNKREYFLIVVKSTVIPMTTENVVLPLIEEYSNKKVGEEFGLCFNPEFLNAKNPLKDVEDPDRIVIGEYDKRSGDLLLKLYETFECPVVRTDMRTAEASKYANNIYNFARISAWNEIDMVTEKIFVDSNLLRKIVQMDRNNPTHPWAHGTEVGGTCLPKDIKAWIAFSEDLHESILFKAVLKVNEQIAERERKEISEHTLLPVIEVSGKALLREKVSC